MAAKFKIMDISGILMYFDNPIIDFCIDGTTLTKAVDLTNGTRMYYPIEMEILGLNYGAFNSFFNERVVREHTQDLRDWLDQLELRHYDFNAMIKKMNGWNGLDGHWVKFNNMGAKTWNEILNQRYPIY